MSGPVRGEGRGVVRSGGTGVGEWSGPGGGAGVGEWSGPGGRGR